MSSWRLLPQLLTLTIAVMTMVLVAEAQVNGGTDLLTLAAALPSCSVSMARYLLSGDMVDPQLIVDIAGNPKRPCIVTSLGTSKCPLTGLTTFSDCICTNHVLSLDIAVCVESSCSLEDSISKNPGVSLSLGSDRQLATHKHLTQLSHRDERSQATAVRLLSKRIEGPTSQDHQLHRHRPHLSHCHRPSRGAVHPIRETLRRRYRYSTGFGGQTIPFLAPYILSPCFQ